MATAAKSAKKLVEKVTARVFCQLEGRGGNPVTIFAPKEALPLLSNGQREQLARTCEWESVFVEAPQMAFYMPTGEQVSFCAHAAMGGAILLRTAKRDARVAFHAATMDEEESTRATHHAIIHEDDIVSLEMNADWVQESVPHPPTLHRMLRDLHNVHKSDLTQTGTSFPTFCNSSIARKKTLVYVNSVEALHRAKPPPPATNYKSACDSIDSTGLYLYSLNSDDGSWECVSRSV